MELIKHAVLEASYNPVTKIVVFMSLFQVIIWVSSKIWVMDTIELVIAEAVAVIASLFLTLCFEICGLRRW